MGKAPKKPAAGKPKPPVYGEASNPPSFVRNLDIPVGRATPPPGSMLKKPKGEKK